MTDTYKPPKRLAARNIEEFLAAMRVLLNDRAKAGHDLRIAQVIGNLGDCYNMEDEAFIKHVWEACD